MELRLEPMAEEQFEVFHERAETGFAAHLIESGAAASQAEAAAFSAESHAQLLPDGLASPGQFLWTGYDGDDEVGLIWIQIEARSDGPHAFIYLVEVREDRRRQGYGRAIMVAAEQICRERGVVSLGLNVFGFNVGARRLYEQLGFETTGTGMVKRTVKPAATPEGETPEATESGVRLEPMTEKQYALYLPMAEQDYARNLARSGSLPEAEAVEKAAKDFARLYSGGLGQPGQLMFTAYDGDTEVGMLGLRLEEKADGLRAYGADFRVPPELRRQGYGRAIMEAADRILRDRGVVSVGLNVFGFNRGAQRLYEQMGFEAVGIQMRKRL
jgi:ribosomal protein S18 acetylase RimI-like enzyme